MSLSVKTLTLSNFRNAEWRELSLSSGLTILVGPNAVGKTNLIEALQLLTYGASFRHARPAELIREGQESGTIATTITGDGRVLDVACEIKPHRRMYRRNGKPCRPQDLLGTLMSILFSPDDLTFVKGSATLRRTEIDNFGSQAHSGYDQIVRTYSRAVEQRNNFLKQDYIDPVMLDAWDESIAAGAAALLGHRYRLFTHLAEQAAHIYSEIAPDETLECNYVSSVEVSQIENTSKDELREYMWKGLQQARNTDIRRQQTTVGPHRDDVIFYINGRDARTYASQGQQRTIVLAWKMAEVELAQKLVGQRPLLLLDDVMSELDENRRAELVQFIESGVQTVVTTTNLGYFPNELLAHAKVVTIDDEIKWDSAR